MYTGARHESSAAEYGTVGINIRARKYETDAEWAAELAKLNCRLPEKTS
ncbi:MAG: hypothetical protein WC837_01155 [Bellilinea sp.]